jgi:hypothetical protein
MALSAGAEERLGLRGTLERGVDPGGWPLERDGKLIEGCQALERGGSSSACRPTRTWLIWGVGFPYKLMKF